MKVRLGGEYKDISGAKTFLSGAWRTIVAIKVFVDGAWRDVANFAAPEPDVPGFTVTAPASVYTIASLSSIKSSLVTVTPSGGLAPYTYAWTCPGATIARPSTASTTFTATNMGFEEIRELTAACVVTDALGSTLTVVIPITFERA